MSRLFGQHIPLIIDIINKSWYVCMYVCMGYSVSLRWNVIFYYKSSMEIIGSVHTVLHIQSIFSVRLFVRGMFFFQNCNVKLYTYTYVIRYLCIRNLFGRYILNNLVRKVRIKFNCFWSYFCIFFLNYLIGYSMIILT